MQVCKKGHQITTTLMRDKNGQNFCKQCGTSTISKCEKCEKPISGYDWDSSVVYIPPVPSFCDGCGNKFPWSDIESTVHEEQSAENLSDKLIKNIFARFHNVVLQLIKRHSERPTLEINDEYDIQDLLHALLKVNFDDIRPEEWNPSYAGSSTRVDFLMPNINTVIECKKTRKGLGNKELKEQLIIDKEQYKKNPNCKILYCFVYDPESIITNPRGFEKDLSEKSDSFKCTVFVTPN